MTDLAGLMPWTLHLRMDDIPWLEGPIPGTGYRMLHADYAQDLFVREVRASPGQHSPLHRHLKPVLGFTRSGSWGHRADRMEYTGGSYIYEPLGTVHRFHNGTGISEILFIQMGDVEWLTEDGKQVLRIERPRDAVNVYLEGCEAAGLPRPNIVS